jgi:hypothetical protein
LVAISRLGCTVRPVFAIDATTTLTEAQEQLHTISSVAVLAGLAPVIRTRAIVTGNTLEMAYAATVPVTRVPVIAAEQQFEILGYGNAALVVNFKNVIGVMLENDLAVLEKSLHLARRISLRSDTGIGAALEDLLQSEVHSQILTRITMPANRTTGTDPMERSVSDEYVARAAGAIKASLVRLYRGHGLIRIFLALAAIVVLSLAIYFLQLNEFSRLLAFTGGLVIVLIAGRVYDRLALRRLRRRFDASIGTKLVSLLKATRSVRNWRRLGFWLTMLALLVAVFGSGGIWLDQYQRIYDEANANIRRAEANAAIQREEAKVALRRGSEQRVQTALSAVVAAKPRARHYLLTCLEDAATRRKVVGSVMLAYGPFRDQLMDGAATTKLFRGFAGSNGDAEKYSQEAGMQMAILRGCETAKVRSTGFDSKAWTDIFRPLFYEAPAHRNYLNLLNTDGESGEDGPAEARRLAELIVPFLKSVGVSLGN